MPSTGVTFEDVQKAAQRIKDHIHFTDVFTSQSLNELARSEGTSDIEIFCKGEFLQKTGSFKVRGCLNSVLALKERERARQNGFHSEARNDIIHITNGISKNDDEKMPKGVITASSGNNGMALAYAASLVGLPCTIVLHKGASSVKAGIIAAYGAELAWSGASVESRNEEVSRISAERNYEVIHDNFDLIAGQGTIALEFMEQVPDLDAILVPTSGGGMVAGISIAAKAINPNVKIYMIEPEGKNSEASMKAAQRLWKPPYNLIDTLADGIRLPYLNPRTWPYILRNVEQDVFTFEEDDLVSAMKFIYQRMKLAIEPTAAAGVAVVQSERFKKIAKTHGLKKVGIILCGGNANLDKLPWIK